MPSIRAKALAFDSASTTTSHTGAVPEHETDDLLLWCVVKDGTGGSAMTTPSGWTALSISDDTSNGVRAGVFYKIATSSSESAPSTTNTSADNWISSMLSIRNADTTTPIHLSAAR